MNESLRARWIENIVTLWGEGSPRQEMRRSEIRDKAWKLGFEYELTAEDPREIEEIVQEACRRLGVTIVE